MKYKVCIKCNIPKPIGKFVLRKDTGKRKNTCNHCNYERQTERDGGTEHLKQEARTHNTCIHCDKTKPIKQFLVGFKTPIRKNVCNRCHFLKHDNPIKRKATAKKYRSTDDGKMVARKGMNKYKTQSRPKYLNTQRKWKTKSIKELSDSYVAHTFVKNKGLLSATEYKKYPQLIDAQRANLRLKRKLKTQ